MICLVLLPAYGLTAQEAAAFEAASIKPAQTPPGRGPLAALGEDSHHNPEIPWSSSLGVMVTVPEIGAEMGGV